jgi:hypothetical protein
MAPRMASRNASGISSSISSSSPALAAQRCCGASRRQRRRRVVAPAATVAAAAPPQGAAAPRRGGAQQAACAAVAAAAARGARAACAWRAPAALLALPRSAPRTPAPLARTDCITPPPLLAHTHAAGRATRGADKNGRRKQARVRVFAPSSCKFFFSVARQRSARPHALLCVCVF